MTTFTPETQLPDARDMISRLRAGEHRCQTGILLLTNDQLRDIDEFAVRLQTDTLDFVPWLLHHLPAQSMVVDVNAEILESYLDEIASGQTAAECLLVYNFDVVLAKLGLAQRTRFWESLRDFFPHRRPLVLSLPAQTTLLLPPDEDLAIWIRGGRFAILQGMEEE